MENSLRTYIPISLDLDSHLTEYPPSEIGYFHKDILIRVLGLITEIPARSDRDNYKNGFVPLNSYILKKIVRNYKHYLNYLIRTGVLVTDNHFIKGEKSKGYKFSPKYNDIVSPIEIFKPSLVAKVERSIRIGVKLQKEHPNLAKWYNEGLCIDLTGAIIELQSLYEKGGENLKSVRSYNHCLPNIYQIYDHNYKVDVDTTAGRLHSPLTRINREIRKFITYEGQNLVSTDIGTSQPYLSTILFSLEFYNPSFLAKISDNKVSPSISYSFFSSPPLLPSLSSLMMHKLRKHVNNQDIVDYIELAINGGIYKFIQTEIKTRLGSSISRDEAKDVLFSILYSTNYLIGQPEAILKRAFRDRFPIVYEVFALIKRGGHAKLPILLQRIESYIVLHLNCKRISEEKPNLPLFTIHDSIITLKGSEDYVGGVMEEVLHSSIGYLPRLKIEYWE